MTHGLRSGSGEGMKIAQRGQWKESGELLCSHAQTKIGAINCSCGERLHDDGPRNKQEVPFMRRINNCGTATRLGDSEPEGD